MQDLWKVRADVPSGPYLSGHQIAVESLDVPHATSPFFNPGTDPCNLNQ